MSLHYIIGDATEPIKKPSVIAHCCNDANLWGAGFVVALRNKFPKSETAYHNWFNNQSDPCYKGIKPELGNCQIVDVAPEIFVANIIGQHGIGYIGKTPPIRYDALEKGLITAYLFAQERKAIMAMPRLGAVLAGGEWDVLEDIIKKVMTVETYVYTLPNQAWKWKNTYEGIYTN